MAAFVVDASVAAKWVIEEPGTAEALRLRHVATLFAPDLRMAECANIFWKKVQRKELLHEEAVLAARLLQSADIELFPMRSLCAIATRMSIELGHPAYDCFYLALAAEKACPFVTADESFVRKLGQGRRRRFRGRAISLAEAAIIRP